MNFNFGNLVSAAVGAVSKVANAVVNALSPVAKGGGLFGGIAGAVIGAAIAVANVCEDGEIDEDEIEEILANVVKVYVGATIAMFGSRSLGSKSDINSQTIEVVDEGKINTEENYTVEEADGYINNYFGRHYMGKKIYFSNEISELPEQIVYKSGEYTHIYKLMEEGLSVPFSSELYYGDEFTTKDGTAINTKMYSYKLAYTNMPEQPQISEGIIFVAPALTVEEEILGYKKAIDPNKLTGNNNKLIKTSRDALKEKPEISKSARKQGANKNNTRPLSVDEKKIANKHLDDIIAARNGDTEAASRLADHDITRVHDLDRQYDGYKSLDLVEKNSGWDNINRLLYKEVSGGIEWKIVRMHR